MSEEFTIWYIMPHFDFIKWQLIEPLGRITVRHIWTLGQSLWCGDTCHQLDNPESESMSPKPNFLCLYSDRNHLTFSNSSFSSLLFSASLGFTSGSPLMIYKTQCGKVLKINATYINEKYKSGSMKCLHVTNFPMQNYTVIIFPKQVQTFLSLPSCYIRGISVLNMHFCWHM